MAREKSTLDALEQQRLQALEHLCSIYQQVHQTAHNLPLLAESERARIEASKEPRKQKIATAWEALCREEMQGERLQNLVQTRLQNIFEELPIATQDKQHYEQQFLAAFTRYGEACLDYREALASSPPEVTDHAQATRDLHLKILNEKDAFPAMELMLQPEHEEEVGQLREKTTRLMEHKKTIYHACLDPQTGAITKAALTTTPTGEWVDKYLLQEMTRAAEERASLIAGLKTFCATHHIPEGEAIRALQYTPTNMITSDNASSSIDIFEQSLIFDELAILFGIQSSLAIKVVEGYHVATRRPLQRQMAEHAACYLLGDPEMREVQGGPDLIGDSSFRGIPFLYEAFIATLQRSDALSGTLPKSRETYHQALDNNLRFEFEQCTAIAFTVLSREVAEAHFGPETLQSKLHRHTFEMEALHVQGQEQIHQLRQAQEQGRQIETTLTQGKLLERAQQAVQKTEAEIAQAQTEQDPLSQRRKETSLLVAQAGCAKMHHNTLQARSFEQGEQFNHHMSSRLSMAGQKRAWESKCHYWSEQFRPLVREIDELATHICQTDNSLFRMQDIFFRPEHFISGAQTNFFTQLMRPLLDAWEFTLDTSKEDKKAILTAMDKLLTKASRVGHDTRTMITLSDPLDASVRETLDLFLQQAGMAVDEGAPVSVDRFREALNEHSTKLATPAEIRTQQQALARAEAQAEKAARALIAEENAAIAAFQKHADKLAKRQKRGEDLEAQPAAAATVDSDSEEELPRPTAIIAPTTRLTDFLAGAIGVEKDQRLKEYRDEALRHLYPPKRRGQERDEPNFLNAMRMFKQLEKYGEPQTADAEEYQDVFAYVEGLTGLSGVFHLQALPKVHDAIHGRGEARLATNLLRQALEQTTKALDALSYYQEHPKEGDPAFNDQVTDYTKAVQLDANQIAKTMEHMIDVSDKRYAAKLATRERVIETMGDRWFNNPAKKTHDTKGAEFRAAKKLKEELHACQKEHWQDAIAEHDELRMPLPDEIRQGYLQDHLPKTVQALPALPPIPKPEEERTDMPAIQSQREQLALPPCSMPGSSHAPDRQPVTFAPQARAAGAATPPSQTRSKATSSSSSVSQEGWTGRSARTAERRSWADMNSDTESEQDVGFAVGR